MKYEELEKINSELKTIDVKGKGYVEVNQRVLAFKKLCPNGAIITDLLSNENGVAVIKATIWDGERVIATGIAYEKENSTFINKTSYIENCETSAVGRALGFVGIGIDTSIASAEEVSNAILQQEDAVIDTIKKEALESSITKNNISDEQVEKILKKYGFNSTAEITISKYGDIVADFRKLCK